MVRHNFSNKSALIVMISRSKHLLEKLTPDNGNKTSMSQQEH